MCHQFFTSKSKRLTNYIRRQSIQIMHSPGLNCLRKSQILFYAVKQWYVIATGVCQMHHAVTNSSAKCQSIVYIIELIGTLCIITNVSRIGVCCFSSTSIDWTFLYQIRTNSFHVCVYIYNNTFNFMVIIQFAKWLKLKSIKQFFLVNQCLYKWHRHLDGYHKNMTTLSATANV